MPDQEPRSSDSPVARTTIAIAGVGPQADAWARALRGIDAVEVDRAPNADDDDLLAQLARPEVDAAVFVTDAGSAAARDLATDIRRVVMTGRHVLITGYATLSSAQLIALDDLAQRRNRVIMFAAAGVADERIAFVRKMAGGAHALWRPRYIRSLHTGAPAGATLDGWAIADICTTLALAGGLPTRLSAVAPRLDDESGATDAVMATLIFEGGALARLDVSLIEPMHRQEVVIACEGRTILLDALDLRRPLQIQAAGGHRGPQRSGKWAETISEHPAGEPVDPTVRTASAFVAAIRAKDPAATNARVLASAALVWETCRQSISRGGEPLSVPSPGPLVHARRPALQLIQGGGHASTNRSVPALTLVARENSPRTA